MITRTSPTLVYVTLTMISEITLFTRTCERANGVHTSTVIMTHTSTLTLVSITTTIVWIKSRVTRAHVLSIVNCLTCSIVSARWRRTYVLDIFTMTSFVTLMTLTMEGAWCVDTFTVVTDVLYLTFVPVRTVRLFISGVTSTRGDWWWRFGAGTSVLTWTNGTCVT